MNVAQVSGVYGGGGKGVGEDQFRFRENCRPTHPLSQQFALQCER